MVKYNIISVFRKKFTDPESRLLPEFSKLNFKFIVIYISISSLPMHYLFIEGDNRMEPDAGPTVA